MFLDLGSRRLANSSDVVRGALAGRGAFGLVFRAEWKGRGPVALKVLQPVPPGPKAPSSALQAYKVIQDCSITILLSLVIYDINSFIGFYKSQKKQWVPN